MKEVILLIILTFTAFGDVFAQKEKVIKGGIINGKATYLPKPEYTDEAKNFCASGKVEVEVKVHAWKGNVISAKAVSGDELLREAAEKAAMQARFSQSNINGDQNFYVMGIVVYNFVPEKKCIDVGIVNKKAVSIPKPQMPNLNHRRHLQIKVEQIVQVQIIIEIWSGKVTHARAISGHLMLRSACEASARQAKFSPVNDVPNIPIKAILVYKFKSNRTVEF